jgi:tetratricopeptide (TPR) repeat protein
VTENIVAGHRAVLGRIERGESGLVGGETRRLLRMAGARGSVSLVAQLRLTLAWIELERGRPAAALRQLTTAEPHLIGADAARARCLRGLHLHATGAHERAHAELTAAGRDLRRQVDRHWLGNTLVARGSAGGYLLRLAEADADYAAAADLFAELGKPARAAACLHNRGFVAVLAGNIPLALRHFTDAVDQGLAVARHPEALVDRAQALLAAGLAESARPVLTTAAELLTKAGRGRKLAEALLTLAQCALQAGAPELAGDAAGRAAVLFGRGRPSWGSAARALALTASLVRGGEVVPAVVRRVAGQADQHGWWLAAAELRLTAARSAGPRSATGWLRQVAVVRRRGPVPLRVLGWLAAARLAQSRGDRRAATAACRAGLRLVAEYTAAVGAWELQAGVSGLACELAELGLAAALAGGRPRAVLRWADRCRAATLRRPAVLPPDDAELAARLVSLRAAVTGARPRQRRIAALEDRVRTATWVHAGRRRSDPSWRIDELVDSLGSSALFSVFVHSGSFWAISVSGGAFRRHELGSTGAVAAALRSWRVALRMGERGARAAAGSAAELDGLLFGAVRQLGDRPLVVVPTDVLHGVPWGGLPSCVGRAVTVAPSVSCWLRTRTADGPRGSGSVWIAGPGLDHAEREVRSLRRAHRGRLLVGQQSTVDRALAAMDGADTVHVAAHGRFREDAPLFSQLDLADGPLYGYDLGRLRTAPRRIVLAACDAGRSAVRPGDEVIGLATALLRGGSSTVVASVLPVPDEAAVALMSALHKGLRAGIGPAEALATAQARHGDLGFICLGAG